MGTIFNYKFKDSMLLREALTHRSYVNEHGQESEISDNERLEFLGDAVIELSISHLLFEMFPEYDEGRLTKMRAMLVNTKTLGFLAREYKIGEKLFLGKGEEQSKGREKDSILASSFEAIIGAIYLDSSFSIVHRVICSLFKPIIKKIEDAPLFVDYKSTLQEYCHKYFGSLPLYKIIEVKGPDHDKFYRIELIINGEPISIGEGKSRKAAEQDAAKKAMEILK